MNPKTPLFKLIIAVTMIAALIMMAGFNLSNAQTVSGSKTGTELFYEIKKMDSILFNAFNKRDTILFKELFTKDLEFFHDKSGLTGFEQTIGFMRSTAEPGNDLRRDLVQGSLEVYPIPGYGAMQIGQHRFCHTENGKQGCGIFKFVHIWLYKEGKWKISRIVSYDH
jgi:hypothetical protein